MTEQLQSIGLVEPDPGQYLIFKENRSFQVNQLVFLILSGLKDGRPFETIEEEVFTKTSKKITPVFVTQVVEQVTQKVLSAPAPAADSALNSNQYIYARFRLLSGEALQYMARPLQFLFAAPWMLLLLPLGAWTTLRFLKEFSEDGTGFSTATHHLSLVLINYLFLAVVSFIHELGHAAAALRYGIKPKEIGFGIYLVFPVLYTDVSQIWRLGKRQRLIVNIAGIYFQLIVTAVLWIAHLQFPDPFLWKTLFITNSILVFYSFNPFLRNDGYWMYSDYFKVPNLAQRSLSYPYRLWQLIKNQPIATVWATFKQEIPLAFYSLMQYTLIALLPSWLIKLSLTYYAEVCQMLENGGRLAGQSQLESSLHLLKIIVLYGLTVFVLIRTIRSVRQAGTLQPTI